MPILTCETGVAAALSAAPAIGPIAYLEFHYGFYCAPGRFCALNLPNHGYVVFHPAGRKLELWVRLSVDAKGVVTATTPEPFPPGTV